MFGNLVDPVIGDSPMKAHAVSPSLSLRRVGGVGLFWFADSATGT